MEGLCSGVLSGTWISQQGTSALIDEDFAGRNWVPSLCSWGQLRSTNFHQNGKCWLKVNNRFSVFPLLQKGIWCRNKCFMVILITSLLTAEWQLTEHRQPLNLSLNKVIPVLFLSCFPAFILWSRSSFCWSCCISFKVERRKAIKFWMLMWWSLTSGPHTQTHTHKTY